MALQTSLTALPMCSMPASMAPGQGIAYHAKRDRVASYVATVAKRHGLRPATLHAMLHGRRPIPQLLAEVIAEAMAEGKHARARHYADLIEAAALPQTGPLNAELVIRKVMADEHEDVLRVEWLLEPECPQRRANLKQALAAERATSLPLWAAL